MADTSTMTMGKQLEKLLAQCAALGLGATAMAALRTIRDDALALRAAAQGSARRARSPRAAKAKGRAGVVEARAHILAAFPSLEEDDILIQTTSVGGSDLHYSAIARRTFPFAPEVKNVEGLNVWAALSQAQTNATKRGLHPILFFKRNNSRMYVALDAETFFRHFKHEAPHVESAPTGAVRSDRLSEAGQVDRGSL